MFSHPLPQLFMASHPVLQFELVAPTPIPQVHPNARGPLYAWNETTMGGSYRSEPGIVTDYTVLEFEDLASAYT